MPLVCRDAAEQLLELVPSHRIGPRRPTRQQGDQGAPDGDRTRAPADPEARSLDRLGLDAQIEHELIAAGGVAGLADMGGVVQPALPARMLEMIEVRVGVHAAIIDGGVAALRSRP